MRRIGDIVIINIDNKPSVYARIEAIEPDIKPKWYRLKLLFLTFPPQEVTWILRREYIDGSTFTMNNVPMHILPLDKQLPQKTQHQKKPKTRSAEVISLSKIIAKKKNNPSHEEA